MVSNAVVAVKKLDNVADVQQALDEAAVQYLVGHQSHPGCVHCVQLLEAHQSSTSGAIYLVMEHVEHSLSREILLNPRGLPTGKVKLVIYQLAQALELLHSKQVCHCDLKPSNVLLTSAYSVKLCDFGSAIVTPAFAGNRGYTGDASPPCRPAGSSVATQIAPLPAGVEPSGVKSTAAASRWYCAPESLLGGDSSPASDVWALGCIMAELVTGKPLMPGQDDQLDQLCCVLATIGRLSEGQEQLLQLLPPEQRTRVEAARARGPLLDKIPKLTACPALMQALRACLQPDPAARPTAQQLQAMPFFDDLRQLLQASEAAAATASKGSVTTTAAAIITGAECAAVATPPLPRRTSSGSMDVDTPANTAPALPACTCDASSTAPVVFGMAVPAGAAAGGAAAASEAQAPRPRFGGVQAAAPLRPAPRPRVSALTATIRGKAFEGDGQYVDLMPQVLQLAARLEAAAADAGLGPIAIAARRASSAAIAASLSPAPSGELLPLGTRWSSGGDCTAAAAAAVAADCSPVAMPMVAGPMPVAMAGTVMGYACATPIAAAVGGCGAAQPIYAVSAASASATAAEVPAFVGGGASPMDASPAVPATAMPARAHDDARRGTSEATKPAIPVSSSVGAVPFLATAFAEPAEPTSAALKVPFGLSAAQLRSRAIINRARRHHGREPRPGSVPSSFLASASAAGPGGGLGSSATLLQQELAAASVAAGGGCGGRAARGFGARPSSGHATRRSFADLTELASVAEYAPLECDTPPDGKRRRGPTRGCSLQPTHGSQPSLGSLATEVSLGSLPEHEPLLEENLPLSMLAAAGGSGGGRCTRRAGSGVGMATGAGSSPLWRGAALRAVSRPQPITGAGRCTAGGGGALGLRGSVCSDLAHSPASDTFLRSEVA